VVSVRSDPRLYNEKPTVTESSFGSQNSSSGVSSQKKMMSLYSKVIARNELDRAKKS
jgi:hypothetical protein